MPQERDRVVAVHLGRRNGNKLGDQATAQYYEAMSKCGRSAGSLRFEMMNAFDRIPLRGRRVLDVGAGAGVASLYAAASGADEVVALEPETAGSQSDMRDRFELAQDRLKADQVLLLPQTFQEFDARGQTFDVLMSFASINHIDEDACMHLHEDPGARAVYAGYLEKLAGMAAPGADLIVFDCARSNLFSRLGVRNPIAPEIEWHKHQAPALWAELLAEAGFAHPRIRWMVSKRLRRPGQMLFGNRLASYATTSLFVLTMSTPAKAG